MSDPVSSRIASLAGAIKGLNEEETLARNNLWAFHNYIYESADLVPSPPFHKEIADNLQLACQHLLTNPLDLGVFNPDYQQQLILAPRGFAKSTLVSIVTPCWLIGHNPQLRIIIASRAYDNAVSFLRQIDHILSKNEKYRRLFGDLVPGFREGLWKEDQKTVRRQEMPSGSKDPSFRAVSTGGSIPSIRSDFIVGDDLIDNNSISTPHVRQGVSDWFWRALLPTLVPWGVIVVCGTRWHANDLYAELMEKWEI